MRVLVCCVLLWLPTFGLAEFAGPVIEVTFDETETIPGQPLTLRLTVLVPTFMPTPPVWPTFETPNLMVRLPSKSSTPTSKTIDGDTWSGITRRYQITPMVAGDFVLSADVVKVSYAAPNGGDPVQVILEIPSLSITGVLPKAAEAMSPFLAARSLILTQDIEGSPDALRAGDSFGRILTVQVDGVAPMFLPDLTPDHLIAGLRAYPESPRLEERQNRGDLSGSRAEKTVYLAETALQGMLPEVSIEWFNLTTGSVETARLPEMSVTSEAALDVPKPPRDWREFVPWIAGLAVVAIFIWIIGRWIWPHVMHWRTQRRVRYLASSQFAWKNMRRASRARDLGKTRQSYDVWAARLEYLSHTEAELIEAQMLHLGRASFAKTPVRDDMQHWLALEALFHRAHRAARYHRHQKAAVLPTLNPTVPK